jgi:proteasome lid subunit RPN8/RPN11
MTVRVAAQVRADVIAHAREEAPLECCGLLVGRNEWIEESIRARNLASRPATRYLLDPAAHIAANRQVRGTGRAVVGFYHSHPGSAVTPSQTDREEACYPALLWMIVSLAGEEAEIGLYRIEDGQATRIPMIEG